MPGALKYGFTTGALRGTVLLNAGRQPGALVFTRRQPTPVTDLQEASEADKQGDEEEPDIAAGEFVYGNRCAECHGEGAAGTDQATSLVGLTLSEDEFEDLKRTGGELGPDHLFGSTKISPDGLSAVYAYLTSLE